MNGKNDYSNSIGLWEHEIGSIKHVLKPLMGDNYKLSKILSLAKKQGEETLFTNIGLFYEELVFRDYKELSEEEKNGLRLWVEMNITTIIKDLLIAFNWTTKEKFEALEKDVEGDKKKLLERL